MDKQFNPLSSGVISEPEYKMAEAQIGISLDLISDFIWCTYHGLISREVTGIFLVNCFFVI